MSDTEIIEYFWEGKKLFKSNKLNNIPNNILEYLENRYNDSLSILETINRIKLNIDYHPICPICNTNLTKYKGKFSSNNIFQKTCDNIHCQRKYKIIKSQQTCISKYGINNPAKLTKIKEKIKKTNQLKYGGNAPLCNDQIKEKTKKTCINKYGVSNVFQSQEIKNKIQNSCIQKYGVKNGGGSLKSIEKIKQKWKNKSEDQIQEIQYKRIKTCNIKYGGNSPLSDNQIKEKTKKTCISKYGVDNPMKSDIIKSKLDYYNISNKSSETKRKNKTFTKSSPEEIIYQLLLNKFKQVIRQYKSNLYPFNCDFYIPSLDLYIEYNGYWTHGFKPFENTKEDQEKLDKWKSKNTDYYNRAIKGWTIIDVNKRNIAKQNNLNYLEFFHIKDFLNWIDNFN